MNFLSKYEWKQIRLIEKKLFLFEDTKIDLFELVNELNVHLSALENVSNTWINDVQSKINCLELIYDSIEDGSISRWQENFEEDLAKTIVSLKKMISVLLNEHLKIPDSKIAEIAIEGDPEWLICPNCNEAWKSISSDAMVFCPKCEYVCHNPRSRRCK